MESHTTDKFLMAVDYAHNPWQPNDHDGTPCPVKNVAEKLKAFDVEPISFVHQDQIKVVASDGLGRNGFHIVDVMACLLSVERGDQRFRKGFGRRTWTDFDADTRWEATICTWHQG